MLRISTTKKGNYTQKWLKNCCCEKILVHILCLKHLMLSAIRIRSGNSIQILVPVTRKVRPPSVSLLYLGHSTLKFEWCLDIPNGVWISRWNTVLSVWYITSRLINTTSQAARSNEYDRTGRYNYYYLGSVRLSLRLCNILVQFVTFMLFSVHFGICFTLPTAAVFAF